MMQSNFRILTALSLFTFAPVYSSYANDFTVGAVGDLTGAAVDSTNSVEKAGLSTSRKFSFGLAATVGLHDGASIFGMQAGAWYVQRKFEISNSALTLVRTVPSLLVPVELTLFPGSFLSASAGGFASFRMGDATDELQVGSNTLVSFSSAQRKSTEFGLTVAGQLALPVAPMMALVGEVRYWRGLTNASENGSFDKKN